MATASASRTGPASRAMARLGLLSEAAEDLLAADDPDCMLQALFRRASAELPVDVYFNFMVDPDGKALHLASCAGVPESAARDLQRLEFGQAVCGTVAARGVPMCPSHIQESDDPLTALVRGLGIRVYACNPLRVGERVIGTLSFGSRSVDRFEPEDLELFRAVSRCVTQAYERLRSEAALRESEAALRVSGDRLSRRMRQLATQHRRKDEFLAMLGHELRNPVAALWSGVEVLREELDGEPLAQVTERMARQLGHLRSLIDDLLDVSRISQGKVKLRKRPCSLRLVVESSVAALRGRIDEKAQALALDVPASLRVEADPDRLQQVVSNLLDNAVRHTPRGGAIRVEASGESPWVTLRVRDGGPGIPADRRERIFDAFSQGRDEALALGLGLGLSLVRQIVELHGGAVWVEGDAEGEGSQFAFRIPGPCAETVPENTMACGGPRHDGSARRVLVVDDNRDAALSLTLLLERRGCRVTVCHSGTEASSVAQSDPPDVVLLDIGLPDVDGCLVARRLREEPALREVRLVALTGYGDDRTRRRIADAGFDHVLLKPASGETLLRVLGGLPDPAPSSLDR